MKNLKKLFLIPLTIAMLITLAACGNGGNDTDRDAVSHSPAVSADETATPAPTEEATPTVTPTGETPSATPAEETPAPEEAPSATPVEETPAPEEAPSALLDLTGNWIERNSNSETFYQSAVIQGNTIEVYWIDEEENMQSLYWAGSYIAPTEATEDYAWDSVNDKSKTDSALLASGDDTKTFTYKNGIISYSVSAMGETATLELVRQ